jgi:hypothetical protein
MFKAVLICIVCFGFGFSKAQKPVRTFDAMEMNDTTLVKLLETYGKNKLLPKGFEQQALLALSFFPELKGIAIEFRLEETITPLASRPTIWSVFRKAEKRHYLITISTKSKGILDSILLGNLDYNAQIGVLAHELSHVATYHQMHFFQFVRLGFGLLSTSYMNTFEYNTDQTCINHGAGYQLLAWSESTGHYFTREVIEKYFGKDGATAERYMFPETIKRKIAENPIYQTETK